MPRQQGDYTSLMEDEVRQNDYTSPFTETSKYMHNYNDTIASLPFNISNVLQVWFQKQVAIIVAPLAVCIGYIFFH